MDEYLGPLAGAAFIVVFVAAIMLLAEGIARSSRRAGVERARDPNTPPEELLRLAEYYPEVLQNPAHPLLSLEDLERWLEIEARAQEAIERRRQEKREYYKDFARVLVAPALMVLGVLLIWLFRRC